MPYESPMKVDDVILKVKMKRFVLPSIQREFVWKPDQVTLLFDSLMQGYPIGSFLLWRVDQDHIHDFQFYDFIRDYHERDARHNPKADVAGEKELTVVLDGQQRLTALSIGLTGSYTYKEPYKRHDNPKAFQKRKLYVDLASEAPEGDDKLYDFRFLPEAAAEVTDEAHWFPVGRVLDFKLVDVNAHIAKSKFKDPEFALNTLSRLMGVIRMEPLISAYTETDQDLDKVLDVFIRANTGGTKLKHSDMLLSIATASWEKHDAREEISRLVDDLCKIGDGFDFDKDFVLKSCLVLADCDVGFKVKNFTKQNMRKIETAWPQVLEALTTAVNLASSFGYSRYTLPTANALVPVAYYLFNRGLEEQFVVRSQFASEREVIRNWLATVILKRTFGAQVDTVLRSLRGVIAKHGGGFPVAKMAEEMAGMQRGISFTGQEVESLLDYEYGDSYIFAVLSYLYPTLDFRNRFHIDHIHPKGNFTRRGLEERGIPDDKVQAYLDGVNRVANLQLLEGPQNLEKSSKDFADWLGETYKDEKRRRVFMERHYIPDVDLSLGNFEEFTAKRGEMILARLKTVLAA